MTADLREDVWALKNGDHLCLLYENDPLEQLPALIPFLRQGLEAGEQCVYIADDMTVTQLANALALDGVDVAEHERTGALRLWTRKEWRQPGELDSASKAAQVRGLIDEALGAGFKGVRFGVEMTWTLGPGIDVQRLSHWEATINTIFTGDVPGRIICQYSRERLDAGAIRAALSTHPIAVLGEDVCLNPYYEAPLLLEGNASNETDRVQWMVTQLRSGRAAQRDREERIRAEVKLLESERNRLRIEQLLHEAEAAAEGLRAANRAKDEFLGIVSHELRTPVTTIYGGIRLLRSRLRELPQDAADELLATVDEEAARLRTLVEDLLAIARVDLGSAALLEPLDVPQIVSHAAREFSHHASSREVLLLIDEELPPVNGEAVYLRQVLMNLLTNAHKYSPAKADIEVAVVRADDAVEISVRDRGQGVPENELEHIFESFYRSESTAKLAPGKGLGLTVCRRLIETMSGKIWARAREGGGLEVVFRLPQATPE